MRVILSALALLAGAAAGCASPPDTNQCANVREIPCDGGYLDDASGAWITSTWTGPRIQYPAYTTLRVCHGLGRPPNSVEVQASFMETGNLAQQIGNVATVVPSCDGQEGVTDRSILLRNGAGQDFWVRIILRP